MVCRSDSLSDPDMTGAGGYLSLQNRFQFILDALTSAHAPSALAIALSGGSDSMALALLAHDYLRERGGKLLALTVDHGLRTESADEAQQVARWMQPYGIEHRILPWQHEGEIPGNLQAAAREARYHLQAAACAEAGISHLLTGHTEDDQAETVALRRQRGAGPVGLAGMAGQRPLTSSTQLLRPLLTTGRAELRDYLRSQSQPWVDDPSNENDAFDRIRIRKQLAENPAEKAALLQTAKTMGAQRRALEERANRWLMREVKQCGEGGGALRFSRQAFVDEDEQGAEGPGTLQYLLLCRMLAHIGGQKQSPRYAKVQQLYQRFSDEKQGTATLAYCKIHWHDGEVTLRPEKAGLSGENSRKPLVVPPFYPIYLADERRMYL